MSLCFNQCRPKMHSETVKSTRFEQDVYTLQNGQRSLSGLLYYLFITLVEYYVSGSAAMEDRESA